MEKITSEFLDREQEQEAELRIKMTDLLREKAESDGQPPLRSAHTISMGLLKGEFTVEADLPDDLKVGLFKTPATYPVLVRMSHTNVHGQHNTKKDWRGFALKLLNVPGEKHTDDPLFQHTQDFILLSVPAIALGTVQEMYIFEYFKLRLPKVLFLLKTLFDGRIRKFLRIIRTLHHDTSPLDIEYWSVTPYFFGDRAVKYALLPTSTFKSSLPPVLTDNYLVENTAAHLSQHAASFDFVIQLFKDDKSTPLDTMATDWSQTDAPYIKVGTLHISPQDFQTAARKELAEDLSFSPAHALKEYRPIGPINRNRVFVYEQLWKFRMEARKKECYEATLETYQNLP